MKNRLLNNWQAKIVCFLIALAIWVIVKNHDVPGFIDQILHGTYTGQ
jgi:YbbR domain-containing protein